MVYDRRNFAAHDVKQDADPPMIVKAIEGSDGIGKRASENADRLTNRELLVKTNQVCTAAQREESLDNAVRHRIGPFTTHDEARHAKRAVHRSPAVTVYIKNHKQIPREQRRLHATLLAGMTHDLHPVRQKGPEALPFQLHLRANLTLGKRMRDVPTLAAGELKPLHPGLRG